MSIFDRFRPYPELETGIINLKSGTSFRAVIYKVAGRFLILRNPELLQDRNNNIARQAVDGEVVIMLSDIDFIQVVR